MKQLNCNGCGVRREVALMFGGFDKDGNCAGCARAEKEAGREERVVREWTPEIAEAMRSAY